MQKNLKIGSLELDGIALLAPMSGITNSPFRRIARAKGASMVFSEMVSADGLVRGKGKSLKHFFKLLYVHPEERPIAFQIFGADPDVMAEAAGMLAEMTADIIDINMGCPVKKVIKKGAGVAMMKDLKRSAEIIAKVKKAIGKVPLTIKMRTGWKDGENLARELCRIAEAEGADGLIIHGRSKEKLFSGEVNLKIIAECVDAVKIPVIGNGGIKSKGDACRMMDETGCKAVMIGRGALGNPWIFGQIKDERMQAPDINERKQIALLHLELMVKNLGEQKAVVEMRKHLAWYSKGLPFAVELRKNLSKIRTKADALSLIDKFFK